MNRLIATAVLMGTMALAGCSDKFTCGQYPSSGCQPVSTVYERTNDGFHDYRKTLYKDEGRSSTRSTDRRNSRRPVHEEPSKHVHVGRAYRALNYASPGDPILSKPVTMRILFNSWVDKEKDLNAGGYVFVRLRDSEWVMSK